MSQGVGSKFLAATRSRVITPLKQATPSRSPTATPPAPQQTLVNTTQPSLVGMTKEEKAAEMNRRKEERKQVSGSEFTGSAPMADNTVAAYCSVKGTKSFQWKDMKQRFSCRAWAGVYISPLFQDANSEIVDPVWFGLVCIN